VKPDAVQIRVLGALLEKQRTTPDVYPLTLNALRSACNQSTNRDPVVSYDDQMIRSALEDLARRRWTRSAGGTRAAKYRHLLNETLQLRPDEQAVLAVLMLRGPQTPGELRQRTARLHEFQSGDELETTIDRLVTRRLAVRLARAPGQKEGRVQQIMGGDEPDPAGVAAGHSAAAVGAAASAGTGAGPGAATHREAAAHPGAAAGGSGGDDGVRDRVGRLEDDVAQVRDELAAVREQLRALRSELGA
jgi:uncharacterized protein YceH (UPF0502 family)